MYPVIQEVPILKPMGWEHREQWYSEANARYHQFYSQRSRTLDLQTDYLKAEQKMLLQLVRQYQLTGPCLEVGCGTGIFAETVPGFIGLDYNLDLLLADGFAGWERLAGYFLKTQP